MRAIWHSGRRSDRAQAVSLELCSSLSYNKITFTNTECIVGWYFVLSIRFIRSNYMSFLENVLQKRDFWFRGRGEKAGVMRGGSG